MIYSVSYAKKGKDGGFRISTLSAVEYKSVIGESQQMQKRRDSIFFMTHIKKEKPKYMPWGSLQLITWPSIFLPLPVGGACIT